MPTRGYSLETGGEKRLDLSWKMGWREFTVRLDGHEVGTIDSQQELKAGREFPLPDGSTLRVQFVQNFISPELQVLRNGRPVPGSCSDPAERLRRATQCVFLIAGLNVVLGCLVELFRWELLKGLGIGIGTIGVGAVFAVLGYFVQRRSYAALVAALGLFGLDTLLSLAAAADTGRSPTGGLIVRIFLFAIMSRGLGAIRSLKQEQDAYAGA